MSSSHSSTSISSSISSRPSSSSSSVFAPWERCRLMFWSLAVWEWCMLSSSSCLLLLMMDCTLRCRLSESESEERGEMEAGSLLIMEQIMIMHWHLVQAYTQIILKFEMAHKLVSSIMVPNNPSHMHTDSKLKTFNSIDDLSDLIHHSQPNNQSFNLQNWKSLCAEVSKDYRGLAEENSTSLTSCYMLSLEDINDIHYKKTFTHSKLYLAVVANLVDGGLGFCSRTLEYNAIELETISTNVFRANQNGIVMYFHTKTSEEAAKKVRLEFEVLESETGKEGEVMAHRTYVGYYEIDPFKGVKSKKKCYIFSPRVESNIETHISYTLTNSDSFKILQKLIPPNCLCGPNDTIPGLAGRKLPASLGIMYSQIEYTELHSLKIDISSIDLNDSLLKERMKEGEEIIRHRSWDVESAVCSIKEVHVEVMFHNGWNCVNKAVVKMVDKMEIQKRSLKKSGKDGKNAEYYKVRHYGCEEVAGLPLVFIDDSAVVVIQIMAKLEVKVKGKVSGEQTYPLSLPINYAYYTIEKLNIDEKHVKALLGGEGLHGGSELQTGKIEFYSHLEAVNKNQLSKNVITNTQITGNKSQIEMDKIMLEKERMAKENRKLKQENRAKKIELNQEIPLLDTTLYKREVYRDEIQRLREERREKEEMLEFLRKKLDELDPNLNLSSSESHDSLAAHDINPNFHQKRNAHNFHNAVFYKTSLNDPTNKTLKNYRNSAFDIINIQNYFPRGLTPLFPYLVPMDIIRTELLEQSYSYAILLNWLTLLPISHNTLLPNKFFFTSTFYNTHFTSSICHVNPSTGQVVSSQEAKKDGKEGKEDKKEGKDDKEQQEKRRKEVEKIVYLEVGPKVDLQNNLQNLIQLISYMYYGYLQIKIIDSNSGIEFGECYLKMRDLIRMRRNEVSVVKDLWVKRAGSCCGRLKVEARCIRKESVGEMRKSRAREAKTGSGEVKQVERIARYKAQKGGTASEESVKLERINKILDEQFVKQEINVNVSRMKPEVIKVDFTNRKNQQESYRVVVNDPDKGSMPNEQLIVMSEALLNTLQRTDWWNYSSSLGVINDKKITLVDDYNVFDLLPGQTGCILLYYYSERKIYCSGQEESEEDLSKLYSHGRCIEVSISNKSTGELNSIFKVNLIPQQIVQTYEFDFTRRAGEKISLQIPLQHQIDSAFYIDDPTVISTHDQSTGLVKLDCFAGQLNEMRKLEVSLLTPYPENRMLINYCFRIWGAREVGAEVDLWESKDLLLDVHTSLCRQHNLEYILALSEDEKAVAIRERNPVKVNLSQSKTFIKVQVSARKIGYNYYSVHLLNPVDGSILTRYSLKIMTPQPLIQERITLRIKFSDKILEEPFGFKNEHSKRIRLKVVSTKSHILWSVGEYVDVEARGQKQIRIKINSQLVEEEESIILTLIGDKVRYNYLFILQTDDVL